jgi:hypothetical protein
VVSQALRTIAHALGERTGYTHWVQKVPGSSDAHVLNELATLRDVLVALPCLPARANAAACLPGRAGRACRRALVVHLATGSLYLSTCRRTAAVAESVRSSLGLDALVWAVISCERWRYEHDPSMIPRLLGTLGVCVRMT